MGVSLWAGVDLAPRNSGAVVLEVDDKWQGLNLTLRPKIVSAKYFRNPLEGSNRKGVVDWASRVQGFIGIPGVKAVGVENYIMSRFATAYENVLFHGALSARLVDAKQSFCLIHPEQLRKFFGPARKVSKEERIDICRYSLDGFPSIDRIIDQKDVEHVADAAGLALVAFMVFSWGPGAWAGEHTPDRSRYNEIVQSIAGNTKEFIYDFKE